MTTFSNAAAQKEAKNSINHTFVGNSYDTQWCKDKCQELLNQGIKAFYKKVSEKGEVKYYVYSFRQ